MHRSARKTRLQLEVLEGRWVPSYVITDLGGTAYDLNNVGEVVGTMGTLDYQTGSIVGPAGRGINDAGQVAGGSTQAFLWDPSAGSTSLGYLAGDTQSQANDLNLAGQVVGLSARVGFYAGSYQDDSHAFLWDSTNGMQSLGPFPDRNYSTATAINSVGQVIGWAQYSFNAGAYQLNQLGFFRDSTGQTTLLSGLVGGGCSEALGINELGQVVGSAGIDVTIPHASFYVPEQAFLWQNGIATGLGVPDGYLRSEARAINNAGQVVGLAYATSAGGSSGRAFLWQNGIWTDLGVDYVKSESINDKGQITLAVSSGGSYLLTPDTITGLSINSVSVSEGDSAAVNAVFTVTRTGPLDQTVSVDFGTRDGTAKAGNDYVAASGTLTFAPGETTKTIRVAVLGDLVDEYDETFSVRLSNASNAAILNSVGVGTILDNDPPPALSITDVTMKEGNSGVSYFVFTVSLSAASEKTISVNYATADGTATSSGKSADYYAAAGTLTFNPGETTKTITIMVIGDGRKEANETFFVNLSSAVNAAVLDGQGLGTILNDD